jgi:two-component system, NarL family, nitrate/nitrite response regulator NarL
VIEAKRPHVVLVDIGASDPGTLDLTRFIGREFPATRIIVGMREAGPAVLRCVESGASGYVPCDVSLEELIMHIRTTLRGETICSPQVAYRAFSRLADLASANSDEVAYQPSTLTPREMEVLQLMVEGLSNKEIAERIYVSLYTVKNHVHNMLKSLGLRNRFELVQHALNKGLVQESCRTSRN